MTEALAVLRGDSEIRQVDIDTVAWLSFPKCDTRFKNIFKN
jgi:hypothetical protein